MFEARNLTTSLTGVTSVETATTITYESLELALEFKVAGLWSQLNQCTPRSLPFVFIFVMDFLSEFLCMFTLFILCISAAYVPDNFSYSTIGGGRLTEAPAPASATRTWRLGLSNLCEISLTLVI